MLKSNLPNLKPGDLVAGRFRIVEMIGSGGFSVVYRAHQEGMNRFVALKVLKPRAANDHRVVERFRREALFASHLQHPNTITLFDYGETGDGLFYIAMEYLKGMDLSVVVQRGEPMDMKRIWKILVQTCRSLAEAHRLGLVHRDLKPENIFLYQSEDEETIKVLDFGVSKAISAFANAGPATMAPLTQEGTVFGTPLYMAPEQAMAEEITPAVDVYALGHITYEMVTGRAAYWDCNNPMDVMLRQVNDPPLALPAPWNKTPFSRLITRLTQKNPRKRVQSAGKMLELLMGDVFEPYADPAERPLARRSLQSATLASGRASAVSSDAQVKEMYRWELERIEDALTEVETTGHMRVVVIRGQQGTGRSNLLRAFLRQINTKARADVIHRQTAGAQIPAGAGLEADVALAAGVDLENKGFDELKRIVGSLQEGPDALGELDAESEIDQGPLTALMSMRDTFLARIAEPFRDRAERRTLIWGVENLERADTLTVAFLDRFVRDLQAHPLPILIVVTVSPEELTRRPGLARYGQRLLAAAPPHGIQLSLVPPGERKEGDESKSDQEIAPPEERDRQLAEVSGSYFGDGSAEVYTEDFATNRIDIGAMGALTPDLLDELGEAEVSEEDSGEDEVFDRVLGFMAQVGDEVPHGLWRKVLEDMLEGPLQGVAPLIVDQAERFGILHQTSEVVVFTKRSYAESLREDFAKRPDAVALYAGFAALLQEFYPSPNREQLKMIVSHLVSSEQLTAAVILLRDAGMAAFRALDFDAAREYYLQIQQLLDFLNPEDRADLDGDGVAEKIKVERPRLWLRLGEIHGALHEYGAGEDALKRVLAEAAEDDFSLLGRACKLLGDLSANQNRFADALRYYEQAQAAFRSAGSARAFVAVTGEMGRCALMQGHTGLAEDLLRQALDNARKLKEEILIARLDRYLGQALTRRSSFVPALEHLVESLELFEKLRRDSEVVLCLEELGNAAYASSQFQLSRDYFTRAIAESASARVALPRSPHLGLARALAAQGNLTQAEAHLLEALALAETAQEPFKLAEVLLYLADLYLACQQPVDARHHLDRVVDLAGSIGHTRIKLDALVRIAYVHFDLGDSEEAYPILIQAADNAQAIGDRDVELQIRAHLIYFQLLEHDFAIQGEAFTTLLSQGKKMRLVRAPAVCWLFRSDVSSARGDYAAAREELKQAYACASQLGDYALFIPIARRDYSIQREVGQLGDPHVGAGYSIGGLVPPEVLRRRFERPPRAGTHE